MLRPGHVSAAAEISALTQHETAEDDAHADESQYKSQRHIQFEPRTNGDQDPQSQLHDQ